jgi:hypothetical protein
MAVMVLAAFSPEVHAARAVKKKKKPPQPGELYFQQGKKTITLTQGELTFRTAIFLGEGTRAGMYGLVKEPVLKVESHPLEIIVFDPDSAGEKVRLIRLGYVETNPASSFDLSATKLGPDYFLKTYKMDYEAAIPINLWCVEKYIPLQITEVANKPGWFRMVPREQLTPGNYWINSVALEGPRYYTGEHPIYPFTLVTPAPPPEAKAALKKAKKAVKRKKAVAKAPPCPPPAPPLPKEIEPPGVAQLPLAAGFNYQAVSTKSPRVRREYQITNLNDHAWHNVQIKIYARSVGDGKFVLGPITQEKDIVLPGHTVNQVPDKTFMHYETLDDQGYKIYLEISAREGNCVRAWQNVPAGESGESNLIEIPWDLEEQK